MTDPTDSAILATLPASERDIRRATPYGRKLISNHIEALRAAGKCHVSGWQNNRRGGLRAIYSAGQGEDMPRPPTQPAKLTQVERQMRWEAKVKLAGAWPARMAKRNARLNRRKQAERQRQTLWLAPLLATPTREYY